MENSLQQELDDTKSKLAAALALIKEKDQGFLDILDDCLYPSPLDKGLIEFKVTYYLTRKLSCD